jgi:Spy/CpxP family protein refolding chaperone
MLPGLRVGMLMAAALAVGAIAFAHMAALLLNEHPVAVDGQVKPRLALKDELLRTQSARSNEFSGVHSGRVRPGNPAHVNKNAFEAC